MNIHHTFLCRRIIILNIEDVFIYSPQVSSNPKNPPLRSWTIVDVYLEGGVYLGEYLEGGMAFDRNHK